MINIRKRNNLYEYRFEAGKVNGRRKQISRCGFKTTKEALRNYQKVIKSSLRDATYYFGFIKYNPSAYLQIPRVLSFELKKRYRSCLY